MKPELHLRQPKTFDIPALRRKMRQLLGEGSDAYPVALEQKFPHVFQKIVDLWGSPAMDAYFQSLMMADRPGRQGFPAEAAMEILRLSLLHASLRPDTEAEKYGWAAASDHEFKNFLDRRQGGDRRQNHTETKVGSYNWRIENQVPSNFDQQHPELTPLVDRLVTWIAANHLLTKHSPDNLCQAFEHALLKAMEKVRHDVTGS